MNTCEACEIKTPESLEDGKCVTCFKDSNEELKCKQCGEYVSLAEAELSFYDGCFLCQSIER